MRAVVRRVVVLLVAAVSAVAVFVGVEGSAAAASGAGGVIVAVGAENEYANVIGQIGGRYVKVTAIESNPNTDPHTFEASPSVAKVVGAARVVVQNGRRLRHLHEQHRERVAELDAEGDRRAEAAGPAGFDAEPAPLVQADDDAGGREGAGRATSRRSSPRTPPTSRPTRRGSTTR